METLPSGLPERVADEEDTRALPHIIQPVQFSDGQTVCVFTGAKKPETSVFRHGSEPRENLWAIGNTHAAQGRNIHGAAIIKARDVRMIQLEAIAEEPPPKHAAIRNWPWIENDPELQKAQQKELANLLASKADLLTK